MTDHPIIIVLILSTLIFFSPSTPKADDQFKQALEQVTEEMTVLNLKESSTPSRDVVRYFKYYGLHLENVDHHFGFFDSTGFRLAAHVFLPENPLGTVYLLHGYLDHTGIRTNLIRFLVSKRFAVAVYDLPGHGLSSGEQASIGDFSQYLEVFRDFLKITLSSLPEPRHLICHSTGCSITLDYLQKAGKPIFDKIIFLAPMVHSAHWGWSKLGVAVADPLVDSVPRDFRVNSSDPAFLEFVRNDPLQSQSVSFQWLRALYEWDKRVRLYEEIGHPVMIVQGTDDRILDWEYNLVFLKKILENVKIEMVSGADHQLVNEAPDLRDEVFLEIGEYLGQESGARSQNKQIN